MRKLFRIKLLRKPLKADSESYKHSSENYCKSKNICGFHAHRLISTEPSHLKKQTGLMERVASLLQHKFKNTHFQNVTINNMTFLLSIHIPSISYKPC